MRLTTSLVGVFFIGFFFFVLPYGFILLNDYLQLPVITHPLLQAGGAVLIAVALLVVLHSYILFKLVGRGTPVPIEPPKKFVVRGLYKYTRNPMYLSYFAIFLGEFLLTGRILLFVYFLLSIPIIYVYTVYFEEPRLKKRFGKDYVLYTKKVPRWL